MVAGDDDDVNSPVDQLYDRIRAIRLSLSVVLFC